MKRTTPTRTPRRRALAAAFLVRWERAGRALERDRARTLEALDPRAARMMTRNLFRLWRAAPRDEGGAGLIRMQRVFRRATNGVAIDVALGATPFEIETVRRASSCEIEPGCRVRTCSAEDLVIHKAIAGRPRDVSDIEGILLRQRGKLDLRRVRRWLAEFASIDGMPAFDRRFEVTVAAVRRRTRTPKR